MLLSLLRSSPAATAGTSTSAPRCSTSPATSSARSPRSPPPSSSSATGWTPIDPILSVLVALLVLRAAWTVVRASGHILLEATPEGFDAAAVAARP